MFIENNECQWDNDSKNGTEFSEDQTDICEDELTDFRQSFDELLKQHLFIKVPALADYFFYWPKSTNSFPMMSIDQIAEGNFKKIILKTIIFFIKIYIKTKYKS